MADAEFLKQLRHGFSHAGRSFLPSHWDTA